MLDRVQWMHAAAWDKYNAMREEGGFTPEEFVEWLAEQATANMQSMTARQKIVDATVEEWLEYHDSRQREIDTYEGVHNVGVDGFMFDWLMIQLQTFDAQMDNIILGYAMYKWEQQPQYSVRTEV